MAPDFERIVNQYGGDEAYLDLLKNDYGASALTADIHPSWFGTASRSPDTVRALVRDSRYIDLLTDAAKSRSFDLAKQYIDDLVAQNSSNTSTQLSKLPRGTGLERSFREPYVGEAFNVLYEYLSLCNAEFCKPKSTYYGRFCSIVQSSGTGKTRTIIQLMQKKVLGLYMNIRPAGDLNAYPPRDDIPAQILTDNLDCTEDDYADRCVAFFTSVFTVLSKQLKTKFKFEARASSEELIPRWSQGMCSMGSRQRTGFYAQVKEEYDNVLGSIRKERESILEGQQHGPNDSSVQESRVGTSKPLEKSIGDLNIEDEEKQSSAVHKSTTVKMTPSSSKESKVVAKPELLGEESMIQAYQDLLSDFPTFFQGKGSLHGPKLVIAIDEASELAKIRDHFQPSHILCRVISSFTTGSESNWVLFASTTSKVADFSALARMNSSLRISQGGKELFRPYSHFGWDQLAKPLSKIEPEKVAQLGNIIGFGRPLWKSLTASIPVQDRILTTASEKLCFNKVFDANHRSQALAVLGQRFCLDICFGHSKSIEFQAQAVSSYLRVCLRTTGDRVWQMTLYPSEPVLSCAASNLLHSNTGHGEETELTPALKNLSQAISSGMLDVGKKGELVSRILYLIAKDLCVRSPGIELWSAPETPGSSWENKEMLDCQPLRVTDYLWFLFGTTAVSQETKDLFNDWYIDFSHWVSMSQFISFPQPGKESAMREWLARHWSRTCAVQCCHDQPMIDKLIPMYKLGAQQEQKPGNAAEPYADRVSYILISDRARVDPTKSHLNSITPENAKIPDLGQPYIAIHADLRVKKGRAEFHLINNPRSTPCLRIYAPRVSGETYSFLATKNLLSTQDALQEILDIPEAPPDPLPSMTSLSNHVQYGDGTGSGHMNWEVA